MKLFDTHAHLDDPRFAEDLDDVMQRSRQAGVVYTVSIGTTAATSRRCIDIAERFKDVYAAVGIQPNYLGKPEAGAFDEIVKLAKHPRVKAIGETGIDCYWEDNAPVDLQRDFFLRHIGLAKELSLPFIVHMRDSGQEILETLNAHGGAPFHGVMHSFTGDWPLAEACLELGMHLSFAGMVTFKNNPALREVAAKVPADRILIETDSPYLTPHPHRGKRPNEPHYLQHTATCLAEVRSMSASEFAEMTTANAMQFFSI